VCLVQTPRAPTRHKGAPSPANAHDPAAHAHAHNHHHQQQQNSMAVEAIEGVRPEIRRAIAEAVDKGGVVTSTDLPYPGKRQVRRTSPCPSLLSSG